MDRPHKLIRFARDDRASVQPLIVRGIFPAFPQPGEHERGIVFHADRVRDFAAYHLMPQSKIVCLKSGGIHFRIDISRCGLKESSRFIFIVTTAPGSEIVRFDRGHSF